MLDADPGSAFPVILELAELGSISSMDRVARCYFFGTGVLADLSQAEAWFRRAFEGGSQSGMLGYAGRLAARGDFETAETVLKVGVARDWAPALYWYYWCSVERSRSRATLLEMRPYLERAYALGSPLAQRSLSRRLSRGQFGLRAIPRGWRLILDFDERSKHKFLSAPEPSA
ncbi:MAG: hypothetical protein ACREEB_05865 [Caulobacteraceae bacterium]